MVYDTDDEDNLEEGFEDDLEDDLEEWDLFVTPF